MIRFFRKYQKPIILVGLPILLVIFLVPQAIQGIADYSARKGRSQGKYVNLQGESATVNAEEYDIASREHGILKEGLKSITGGQFGILDLLGIPGVDKTEHWLLLKREAESLGLTSNGIDEARLVAQQIGQQLARLTGEQEAPEPDVVIGLISRDSQSSPAAVAQALVQARSVQRMVMLYSGTLEKLSTRRVDLAAAENLQGIDARVVVIPAKVPDENAADDNLEDGDGADDPASSAQPLPEPTEAQLQAQLEKYKDIKPGEGEDGFGYQLPDRIKLEWIAVNAATVRGKVADSDKVSSLNLKKHWVRNKEDFRPQGVTGEVIFEDVEPMVRNAVLTKETDDMLDSIGRFLISEQARTTRELPRDENYIVLPDDWSEKQVNFFELANAVQEEYGILPSYSRRNEQWYSVNDLRSLEGIGRAFLEKFGRRLTLADYVTALKEFGGDDLIYIQEDVASSDLLELSDGSLYFFRITDTAKAQPAERVDDVREQLIADVKQIAAYERLVARQSETEQLAIIEGMEAVADEFDSSVSFQQNIGYSPEDSMLAQYGRNATTLPSPVGRDEAAIDAIVEQARQTLSAMLAEGETFRDLSIEERTFVVAAPHKRALIVVQLTGLRPVVQDELAAFANPLRMLIVRDELGGEPLGPFSYETMMKRYNYESLISSDEDEEFEEEEAADDDEEMASTE